MMAHYKRKVGLIMEEIQLSDYSSFGLFVRLTLSFL